jgi:hypothetical protein
METTLGVTAAHAELRTMIEGVLDYLEPPLLDPAEENAEMAYSNRHGAARVEQ